MRVVLLAMAGYSDAYHRWVAGRKRRECGLVMGAGQRASPSASLLFCSDIPRPASEKKSAITKGVASAWAAFKYALNPEEQAAKLVTLLRSKNPDFTKRCAAALAQRRAVPLKTGPARLSSASRFLSPSAALASSPPAFSTSQSRRLSRTSRASPSRGCR